MDRVAEYIGDIEDGWQSWTGSYRDWKDNLHQRTIKCKENTWVIEDRLEGRFERAEIRFRLMPGGCRLENHTVFASWGRIQVASSGITVGHADGMESLYYQHKQPVDTLVITVGQGCHEITTRIVLGPQ